MWGGGEGVGEGSGRGASYLLRITGVFVLMDAADLFSVICQ